MKLEQEEKTMTAKEVLNLIDWLREQGFDNDKVVECIEAVEGKKEKKPANHQSEGEQIALVNSKYNSYCLKKQ